MHRRTTCTVTSFFIEDPPDDGVTGRDQWLAIATTHVYDESPDTKGILTKDQAILAGAVVRVLKGVASAKSEEAAMLGAIRAVLYQRDGQAATVER